MSLPFLHLLSPGRDGDSAVIAGNAEALRSLQRALEQALDNGAAAIELFCSDGEPFLLTLVREHDMSAVFTAYRDEAHPERSQRERRPLRHVGQSSPAGRTPPRRDGIAGADATAPPDHASTATH